MSDARGTTAALAFVGTATTVLELGCFTLLTDPNFLHRGQRAYLGKGLWSRTSTRSTTASPTSTRRWSTSGGPGC